MVPSGEPKAADGRRYLAIVPAFNESDSIARVVGELNRHLPHFDVLVIDDGSVDATLWRIPRTARAVSLPFNLGIGGAMQTGYRYAAMHGYDVAVQVDADGQHPPSQVQLLVDELNKGEADAVIGSRFLKTIKYRQTLSRMVGIHVLRWTIQLLAGLWVTDPTSGFRAVNRRVIRLYAHWYPEDYPEPEVVLLLHKSGYRVRELQVEMHERTTGQTSIPLLRGLFYVVKVCTCLMLDMLRDPWPRGKVNPS